MKTYIKTDYSQIRTKIADGWNATCTFRSAAFDELYFDISGATCDRWGYPIDKHKTQEYSLSEIKDLPKHSIIRRIFAQYRLMQRDDRRQYIADKCNGNPKKFWKYVK